MGTVHNRTAALILLSTALISASFTPVLANAAPALWASALAVSAGAVGLAMRLPSSRARQRSGSRPRRLRGLVIVACLVVGGLVGSLVVQAPSAHADPVAAGPAPAVVPAARVDVSPTRLIDFAQAQADLTPITGDEARDLVGRARQTETRPRSGLEADYANARAFQAGSVRIVSVPLLGRDLPQVSNLTFVATDETVDVVENAASLIDDEHAVYRSWTDGRLTRDVVLTKPGSDPDAAASARGFSMDRLKKCLNENGIAWAVLLVVGVSCSAACATAVLCLPCVALYAGITGGALSRCVGYAFG
ncbi:hypothetical protein [Frondihabitans peucedani]|uniref:Uncharacterized protein n=1 Tax=Frondihabitans peucedani TaxID=598626 RepID=A0ABP8E2C3_9MICO